MVKNTILVFVLFLFSSCFYFRAIPEHEYTGLTIQQYEESGKILILRRGDLVRQISEVQYEDGFIAGKLDFPMVYHFKYLYPKEDKLNRFKKSMEPEVIHAVHLYTSDTTFNKMDSTFSIPLSTIYAVQSYEYARAPSRASIILPVVFVPILFGLLVASANAASFASM